MEGDGADLLLHLAELFISIHALRMEGDQEMYDAYDTTKVFLSTPSAWRATG